MKRREFLTVAAVGAAAAATMSTRTRRASALPLFGDVPAEHASVMLPKAKQVTSILEIFLKGGLTPWETFYCVPEFGANNKTWHNAYPTDFANACLACGNSSASSQAFTPFAPDSQGRTIYLSPFLRRLTDRADVTNRLRIVVNRHKLGTHEGAVPLAITGQTLGARSFSSLGAHVARYFLDRDVDRQHVAPFAYGLAQTGLFDAGENTLCLSSVGLHPGAVRPLVIAPNNSARLQALLARAQLGDSVHRAQFDALQAHYLRQYQARLTLASTGESLRSSALDSFGYVSSALAHSADMQALLSPEYLTSAPGTACFTRAGLQTQNQSTVSTTLFANSTNYPAQNLKLAAHLLTHPTSPAKHVIVFDEGLKEADGGGGYDTHNETPFTHANNLYNLLSSLLPLVNVPGEGNPVKIDLDQTLIILNTEFGRTMGVQANKTNTGRGHWENAYAQMYIGGPVQKGVYGVIPEDGFATTFTTPVENRIAALLAMGIWPFDDASYSSGHVQDNATESIAVRSVMQRVLGYTV